MIFSLNIAYTEEDFIRACLDKNNIALRKLYEDNYPIMYPICLRYANNDHDALDILHDGFIKVIKNLDKYKTGTSLVAWIKRIMVNTAIDYYRSETRRKIIDIEDAKGITTNDVDCISSLTSEELLACLQMLTPSYRSVFNLYVIEGFSHKELSDILGITESTSRSNLVKARLKLKDIIQKRFGNTFEHLNKTTHEQQ